MSLLVSGIGWFVLEEITIYKARLVKRVALFQNKDNLSHSFFSLSDATMCYFPWLRSWAMEPKDTILNSCLVTFLSVLP